MDFVYFWKLQMTNTRCFIKFNTMDSEIGVPRRNWVEQFKKWVHSLLFGYVQLIGEVKDTFFSLYYFWFKINIEANIFTDELQYEMRIWLYLWVCCFPNWVHTPDLKICPKRWQMHWCLRFLNFEMNSYKNKGPIWLEFAHHASHLSSEKATTTNS